MLEELVQEAFAGGYVTALALVCLMQYVYHLCVMSAARRANDDVREELEELEGEMQTTREEALVSRLENEFLNEFVAQTKLQHAAQVLLEHLAPNPASDFAALFLFEDGRLRVHEARGLSPRERRRVKFDRDTVRDVVAKGQVVLDENALGDRGILAQLDEETQKTPRLYLLRLGEGNSPIGIVASTSLYPKDIPESQQLQLARRLMSTVATNIRWARTLETNEAELKSTNEILELRAITDRRFPSPLAMVEAFVDRLRRMLGVDRAALYLASGESTVSEQAIVRCGESLAGGPEGRWREHEELAAVHGLRNAANIVLLQTEDLARLGIASIVEGAVVSPVRREFNTMGVIVFSNRQEFDFSDSRAKLVEWACGHLGESLDRVLHHADTERKARQDPLTGLANRREFDERIAREVDLATSLGKTLSLLLIDLDHFKSVNDTYGHRAGDDVLRVTARILERGVARVRAEDRALIARYGGEELAVLFPGMNSTGAQRIAEELRSTIEQIEIPADGKQIRVTASFGVASCPASASDVAGLVAAADAALYQAKELGRNRVVCAIPQFA